MANGRPRLPGVGTSSRIPDVQAGQSAFNLRQEEMNRQSGLALLGLLADTGIDVATLVERAREAAAQRAFERGEREAGQEFAAGESSLDRLLRERLLGTELESRERVAGQRESGLDRRAAEERLLRENLAGDRQAFDLSQSEADRGFTLERDQGISERAAAAATLKFQREQQLAQSARDRVPQEQILRIMREMPAGILADFQRISSETGLPVDQAAVQQAIDASLGTFMRNHPEIAEQSPLAGPFRERQQTQRRLNLNRLRREADTIVPDAVRAARRRQVFQRLGDDPEVQRLRDPFRVPGGIR